MLEFRSIRLEDKGWITELLSLSDYIGCEYSFGNAFIWKDFFDIKIARFKDFFICMHGDAFVFPAGQGDLSEVIEELKTYCKSYKIPLFFLSMDKSVVAKLESLYPSQFEFSTDRNVYDYVYTCESLSTLKGKKLHSKRNFINRFKEYNWSFEYISHENIDDCKKMSLEWCKINSCDSSTEKYEESCAVAVGLENYFELGFEGILLRKDGNVIAFSYGEKLNSNTFDVHVEKAFSNINGAYPMINYLMANYVCNKYKFINREEDMGEENLRKAKLSYHPVFLVEKYKALYIG